jgi:hypothetical protein
MVRSFALTAVWPLLCAFPCLYGQEAPAAPTLRRLSFGLRFQAAGLRLFKTNTVTESTTSPLADYTYTGSSDLHRMAVFPGLEYRLTSHLTLGLDLLFHHALYRQKTEIRTGKKDSNASTDDRPVTVISETTKANYWEVPLLARYYGLRKQGLLSKFYVAGGPTYRRVGKIRTGTEYAYADATSDYHEAPATPNRRNQFGSVAAVGLRFIDDIGVKVTPEIRFVRWQGLAFQGTSYRSTQNDVSIGLGLAF